MKYVYYKSKNSKYPGYSIDEIKDDEFEVGFEFKIVNGTKYAVSIENNKMTLLDYKGNKLGDKNIGAWNYGKVFKDLIDNEGIKLRALVPRECGEFDFGFEESTRENSFQIKKTEDGMDKGLGSSIITNPKKINKKQIKDFNDGIESWYEQKR